MDSRRQPAVSATERASIRASLSRRSLLGAAGLGVAGAIAPPLTALGGPLPYPLTLPPLAAGLQSAGEITVVQSVDTNTLDPQFHNDAISLNFALHLFDTPFILDQEAQVVPRLAESYENLDELTWEFKLHEGAQFHNGEPVNAEAVEFSINRIATNDPPVPDPFIELSNLDRVEVVDDYTFRLITSAPAADLLGFMTKLWVLPPRFFTETPFDELQRNPVGSGPYRFVEWVPDDYVILEANQDYWGGAPPIQRITFRPVAELSTRVALLQAGEADLINNVGPDQAVLLDESEGTKIASVETARIIFVGMRTDTPPLDDPRVRRAVNLAVDFDTINEQLLAGFGQRAATINTPAYAWPEAQPIAYDPDQARALLQEAGIEEGLTLTLDTPSNVFIKDTEIAQAVAQMFTAVGLNVQAQTVDQSVLGDRIREGGTSPLFLWGYGSPFIGQVELERYTAEGSIGVATHWVNQEFNDLYGQLEQTFEAGARLEIMHQMQQVFLEELPTLPLYFQVGIWGLSDRLMWEAPPHERVTLFTNATLAE